MREEPTEKVSRIPLGLDEIVLMTEAELTPSVCARLLDFSLDFHTRTLSYFLSLRESWHLLNREQSFQGLCANVNPLTGVFRPPDEQRHWGWGDTRALGTWSSFLNTNRVPDEPVNLKLCDGSSKIVNLKTGLEDYVDIIYSGLMDRYRKNRGSIPFSAYVQTGLPDGNPKNRFQRSNRFDFCKAFAVNGLLQYGMLKKLDPPVRLGLELLGDQIALIESEGMAGSQGPRMILLGVIGDVMKTIAWLYDGGVERYWAHKKLAQDALPLLQHLLDNHFRWDPPGFWEEIDADGHPLVNDDGNVIVDPGHATECAGFLGELIPFLPPKWDSRRWDREKVLQAALEIHLFADRIGFTDSGVMTKYAELKTGEILPDTQAASAGGRPTAPWFNIREHCAAALRLYTLTRDKRLVNTYRKAQNATYLYYPNKRIGGMLVQTVDPVTLEPLDIAPATGNLDPMHDGRARIREIENLELICFGTPPRYWQ